MAGKCSHLPYPRIYGIHDRMMLEEEVVQLRTENQELKQQLAQVLQQLAAAQQRIAELEQQRSEAPPGRPSLGLDPGDVHKLLADLATDQGAAAGRLCVDHFQ